MGRNSLGCQPVTRREEALPLYSVPMHPLSAAFPLRFGRRVNEIKAIWRRASHRGDARARHPSRHSDPSSIDPLPRGTQDIHACICVYVPRLDRDWTVISGNEAMLRCKTWRKEGRGEQRRGVDWIFAFVESRSGIIAIVCRGEMMRERFDFVILIVEEGKHCESDCDFVKIFIRYIYIYWEMLRNKLYH